MIYSSKFTAVLDACVLYPAPVRDLLLNLASLDLYKPKTDEIHEEWTRNLLKNRPDLKFEQLQWTIGCMNDSFPDSNVENYQALIGTLILPDPNDRHILAAAVRCKAEVIVTSNLLDFPNGYLSQFDIEAQHPDYFISNLIDLNPKIALKAFEKQVSKLKNPPKTREEVLGNLVKNGLSATVSKLNSLI